MGNNLGFREITGFTQTGLKILNDTLRVLWSKLLGNVEYKDLGGSAKKVIDSKASGEAVSELSGMYAQLETEVSQTQEEILLRATKEDLDKLQAEVNVQGGEISLRVTQTQLSEGLAGKLDADAPSAGVATASAVVNEKGVYLTGGEIDMRTTDGEDYVNITDEGVSASSMSAPDVMPRYAGDSRIYVDPLATSEEIATGWTYRSLQEALNALNGKVAPYGVAVILADGMTEYGDVFLQNAFFPAGLTITASYDAHAKLVGQLSVIDCAGRVTIQFVDVQAQTGVNSDGIYIKGTGAYVKAEYCVVTGNGNANSCAVYVTEGANAHVAQCEMYDCGYAVRVSNMSQAVVKNNKGNCQYCADAGIIFATGTAPSSSSAFGYVAMGAGQVFTTPGMSVDQGSGGSMPAVPTIGSISIYAENTTSYEADGDVWNDEYVIQGWWKGGGRIRGCMWFDNASIRSALSGKSVLSAALRLSMRSSGRGTAVTVELAGTSANAGGNPAVTRTYGAIATMSPGETATIALPAQVITDLLAGTINGLMLYSSDTGSYKEREYSKNYAAFAGADGGAENAPMLTVTYEG